MDGFDQEGLARGEYPDPGVRPLEMLAADREAAEHFERGLTELGIGWTREINEVETPG